VAGREWCDDCRTRATTGEGRPAFVYGDRRAPLLRNRRVAAIPAFFATERLASLVVRALVRYAHENPVF